jgi:hypothetical protein
MPRKPVNSVQEFRITLGDFERKTLTKQLNEDDTIKKAESVSSIVKATAITGALISLPILGSVAVKAYREASNVVENVADKGASGFDLFLFGAGLMPLSTFNNRTSKRNLKADEEEAKGEQNKNIGFLEWGFDAFMTFLLGEDKEWTQTTVVKEDEIPTAIYQDSDYAPYDGAGPRTPWQDYWLANYGSWDGYDDTTARKEYDAYLYQKSMENKILEESSKEGGVYSNSDYTPYDGAGPRTPWQDFWLSNYGSWDGYVETTAREEYQAYLNSKN